MTKLIFVNLPVANLARATAFYEAVGAKKNIQFCDASTSCMVFSETIPVMLTTHDKFRQLIPKRIANANETSEMLICISGDSREDVDNTIAKASAAGGRADPCPEQDYGFVYSRSFEDPDGHIWEVMWISAEVAQATTTSSDPEPS
jgi:predicted lactoylglutathione lyase